MISARAFVAPLLLVLTASNCMFCVCVCAVKVLLGCSLSDQLSHSISSVAGAGQLQVQVVDRYQAVRDDMRNQFQSQQVFHENSCSLRCFGKSFGVSAYHRTFFVNGRTITFTELRIALVADVSCLGGQRSTSWTCRITFGVPVCKEERLCGEQLQQQLFDKS